MCSKEGLPGIYRHVLESDWGRSNRFQGYSWPFIMHCLRVRAGVCGGEPASLDSEARLVPYMITFDFLKCYLCKDRDWFWETWESSWLLSFCHHLLTSIYLQILIHLNYSLRPYALWSPYSASAPVQIVIQNWWLLSLLGCFGLPSFSSLFCPVTDRTVWLCTLPDETHAGISFPQVPRLTASIPFLP